MVADRNIYIKEKMNEKFVKLTAKIVIASLTLTIAFTPSRGWAKINETSGSYLGRKKQYLLTPYDPKRAAQIKIYTENMNNLENILMSAEWGGNFTSYGIEKTTRNRAENFHAGLEERNKRSEKAKTFAKGNYPFMDKIDVEDLEDLPEGQLPFNKVIDKADGSIRYSSSKITVTRGAINIGELGMFGDKDSIVIYGDDRLPFHIMILGRDKRGNETRQDIWEKWHPDSCFTESAFKGISKSITKTRDAAGNTVVTEWTGEYKAQKLTSSSEYTKDSVNGERWENRFNIQGEDNDIPTSYEATGIGFDGLSYHLKRHGITYNDEEKKQTTGYDEEKIIYNDDGSEREKITTHMEFTYTPNSFPDEHTPDFRTKSIAKTTVEYPDGAVREEVSTTFYHYEGINLSSAEGTREIDGREASWWEHKDTQGHNLIKSQEEDKDVYFYIDKATGERVYVPESEVTSTLNQGKRYTGHSEVSFEILNSRPMVKNETTYLSFFAVDGTLVREETTEIEYDLGLVEGENAQGKTFSFFRNLNKTIKTTTIYPGIIDKNNNPQGEETLVEYTYKFDDKGNPIEFEFEGDGTGSTRLDDGSWRKYRLEISGNGIIKAGREVTLISIREDIEILED